MTEILDDRKLDNPENDDVIDQLYDFAATGYSIANAYGHTREGLALKPFDDLSHGMKELFLSMAAAAAVEQDWDFEEFHNQWVAGMSNEGWIYGFTIDKQAGTHPWIRPYEDMPDNLKTYGHIVLAVLRALSSNHLEVDEG